MLSEDDDYRIDTPRAPYRGLRVYVSGPMTDLPNHNFEAFFLAEARLHANGFTVTNPARNFGGRTDLPRRHYMRMDLHGLLASEAIHLLPGWHLSKGALLEVYCAAELELPFIDYDGTPLTAFGPGVAIRNGVAERI